MTGMGIVAIILFAIDILLLILTYSKPPKPGETDPDFQKWAWGIALTFIALLVPVAVGIDEVFHPTGFWMFVGMLSLALISNFLHYMKIRAKRVADPDYQNRKAVKAEIRAATAKQRKKDRAFHG